MITNDSRLPVAHRTWWKAPMAATLPGLPLLVGELSMFYSEGYTSGIEIGILLGVALLAVAWLLPHRRSMRGLRMMTAGGALALAILPLLYAVLLGVAMSSG
ncbi:hypothetical protein ACFWM0_06010 [Streptomyces sp. NPDC058405]|uniref:hypothetical protein n=1 Tax=unclassified Streptomyces TaxID=2593676 RepID=UPI00366A0B64